MKNIICGEGVIALTFLCAGIILLASPFGILTIPGLVMAALGVVFILKRKYGLASAVGILTATGSYTGQLLTVYCSSCTLAATLFAIGGILTLILIVREKPIFALLMMPLVISVVLLGTNMIPKDTRPMMYVTPTTQITEKQETVPKKPKLFFSVSCKSCSDVIKTYVSQDPTGQYWQPVVVPQMMLSNGEELLRGLGYTGPIYSAPKSPSQIVPCLLIKDNEMYSGSQKTLAQIDKIRKGEER